MEHTSDRISAKQLKMVACERKYAGHYLHGLKEEQGPGALRGVQFHKIGEAYQETGQVIEPESDMARVFMAGVHLLDAPGSMCSEYEHEGFLFDNVTKYVAKIDAHSTPEECQRTGVVRVRDLKTTSNPTYALTEETLLADIQAGLYSWVLLTPHKYRKNPEIYGDDPVKNPWLWWLPNGVHRVDLTWTYFLTKGKPRAWEVKASTTVKPAVAFVVEQIMPLVEKIKIIRARRPELNATPHNMGACAGVGEWCGAYSKCDMDRGVPPLVPLANLTRAPRHVTIEAPTDDRKDTEDMGLEALKAKLAQQAGVAPEATPAATPAAAPKQSAPPPAAQAEAPATEVVTPPAAEEPAPASKPRTRAKPPAAPPGGSQGPTDTINPPEATQALAKLRSEPVTGDAVDQHVAALNALGYVVQLTRAPRAA